MTLNVIESEPVPRYGNNFINFKRIWMSSRERIVNWLAANGARKSLSHKPGSQLPSSIAVALPDILCHGTTLLNKKAPWLKRTKALIANYR